MELTLHAGWWSLLPPLVAIALALLTKEVLPSLLAGILAGALVYTGGNPLAGVETAMGLMAHKIGEHADILVFLGLLGALVTTVTMAGGSRAYGEWASGKIRSRAGAQLATAALGCLLFIDDYFNCLTVGTVMRPVTDRHGVSRAKLAYILDATAAPVCILAPVSSWAASVVSYIPESTGFSGLDAFVRTIPYNFYAIATLVMVAAVCALRLDFGPMAAFERNAMESRESSAQENPDRREIGGLPISDKGRVLDLILPVGALIACTIAAMLYLGGLFDGRAGGIAEAFGATDAARALVLGGFAALVVAFIQFVPRGVVPFKRFISGVGEGVKSMVPAFLILILAWTISGVCRELLGTGAFVGELVRTASVPAWVLPAAVFVVSGVLAFSMGTSWGTFGILIPIVAEVAQHTDPSILIPAIAATLAGAVYGDHCSPISDTTILSSTGAGCGHIDHVSTQMAYTSVAAACCLAGYLLTGWLGTPWIPLAVTLALLGAALLALHRKAAARQNAGNGR